MKTQRQIEIEALPLGTIVTTDSGIIGELVRTTKYGATIDTGTRWVTVPWEDF